MAGALALRWWLYQKGDETSAFYSLTPCRIDELAMGGLLALIARQPLNITRLKYAAYSLLLLSAAALAAIWNTDLRSMIIGGTLLAFLFGALIVIVLTANPRNPARQIFSLYPMRTIGKFSYAMYVLHPLLLVWLGKWLFSHTHSGGVGIFMYMIIAFAATLCAGWLSWHLYEKHFLKLKRFFNYSAKRGAS
jgi:peptidoglycan/LPS O-acetylase OafA/YrhL